MKDIFEFNLFLTHIVEKSCTKNRVYDDYFNTSLLKNGEILTFIFN